ncbi:MAG: polysaccharide pyruvyl transferase family protein [Arenicellales bacterium]
MFVFSKRLSSRDHIVQILLCRLKMALFRRRRTEPPPAESKISVLDALMRSDLVLDASSGDGFTDLYGVLRFYKEVSRKWLALILGRKLVLLPQSIGPFLNPLYGAIAGYILRHSHRVFVRDAVSLARARRCAGRRCDGNKIKLVPDLAFALETPDDAKPRSVLQYESDGTRIIGINVSGLLLNEPLLHDFKLKAGYRDTVVALIDEFLSNSELRIVLVPHVLGAHPESDETACQTILETYGDDRRDRIRIGSDGSSTVADVKHVISQFEFFIGARMHACIAALSQGVPTLGLAYSDKFAGVFETVGLRSCVADLRTLRAEEIAVQAWNAYRRRAETAQTLSDGVRQAKASVCTAMDDIDKC